MSASYMDLVALWRSSPTTWSGAQQYPQQVPSSFFSNGAWHSGMLQVTELQGGVKVDSPNELVIRSSPTFFMSSGTSPHRRGLHESFLLPNESSRSDRSSKGEDTHAELPRRLS
mmetsp:Transcript_3254/g.7780  ORF Transcript_3254/g.7780 Transcript_3254/m.7780 type:complete len:114 (-) Transcript_3254:20-361(-)